MCLNASNWPRLGSQTRPYWTVPLRPACMAIGTPASSSRARWVVVGHARRLVAASGRYRSGDGAHDAGAHLQQPLQLVHRQLGIGEGEHGRGEDAAVAVEAPVLVEPGVEGAEGGVQGFDVALRASCMPTPWVGNSITDSRPCWSISSTRAARSRNPGCSSRGSSSPNMAADVAALQVAAPEVVLKAARLGDRVEGRVGDELVDLAGHHEALPAVDLGPLHAALLHRRVDVADEGVGGFVVVLVHIEGPETQVWLLCHRFRCYPGARPAGPVTGAPWRRERRHCLPPCHSPA